MKALYVPKKVGGPAGARHPPCPSIAPAPCLLGLPSLRAPGSSWIGPGTGPSIIDVGRFPTKLTQKIHDFLPGITIKQSEEVWGAAVPHTPRLILGGSAPKKKAGGLRGGSPPDFARFQVSTEDPIKCRAI